MLLCLLPKTPKKISYLVLWLLVVVIMPTSFTFSVTPEAYVFTVKQRGAESLKDSWYRINDSQKRATKKQSTTILLRFFFMLELLLGIGLF